MRTHWHDRWDEGRLGFHMSTANPLLERFAGTFLSDGPHTVLVPLAGKTLDILWLLERGHRVVAVELVEKAVETFHSEHGIEATRRSWGKLQAWESPGLLFLQGDVLHLEAEHLAGVDRIWDRAALVALPPELRLPYATVLRTKLTPGWKALVVTFAYDQEVMEGPPFCVPDETLRALYEGYELEKLHEADIVAGSKFEERGLDSFISSTWLITRTP